ncbi:MAG: hypothetical protein LBS43_09955 [Prevotellaceae bacterium]|nr:hypothetical protein [Prevotellaceae bacterium]
MKTSKMMFAVCYITGKIRKNSYDFSRKTINDKENFLYVQAIDYTDIRY